MEATREGKRKLMEPQELITMARQLGDQLKQQDISATDLLLRGRSIQRSHEAVQELSATLGAYSTVPFLRTTRPEVIKELQHERRVLQALRQENEELRQAVQENGDAIQYVMKKYRQHSKKLYDLDMQDLGCVTVIDRYFGAVVRSNVEDLEDMIFLSKQAVCDDDIAAARRDEILKSIGNENRILRSALNISSNNSNSRFVRVPVAAPSHMPPDRSTD